MAEDTLFDPGVGRSPTWTVPELAAHIGRVVSGAFPDDLWVEGQIRNLTRSANGHAYFTLVEPTAAGVPPRAQVSVALLAAERRHVNAQLTRAGGAVRMDDGIEVRIQGRLRWYGPRGTLQLRMHGIDPTFTLGRLQADRDRILAALATEGLLDANGARPLPPVPLRIGLVTSRGSAAHADVMAQLEASGIGFHVRFADARTQGADCGPSVLRALRRLTAEQVELVLLVRGGGARTDLAGFDTDVVARAIAAMPVPVFTGIGHETDRSIADEVAHTALKTPTAAAAAAVDRVRAFSATIDHHGAHIARAASSALAAAHAGVEHRSRRTARAGRRTLDRSAARLDEIARRTGRAGRRSLHRADHVLLARTQDITRRAGRSLADAERTVTGLDARARAHDPSRALARGWTITTTALGDPINRVADLAEGTSLVTRFVDGVATSTVTHVDHQPVAGPDPDHTGGGEDPPAPTEERSP